MIFKSFLPCIQAWMVTDPADENFLFQFGEILVAIPAFGADFVMVKSSRADKVLVANATMVQGMIGQSFVQRQTCELPDFVD